MNPTLPKHVAVVMDGNGRWAVQQGQPRIAGHAKGVESLKTVVKAAQKRQIDVLSVFAFSTENWCRPQDEVQYLMELFMKGLQQEVPQLHDKHIKLRFIGDLSALEASIQTGIQQAEATTANNQGLTLVIAVNYGGQWDIAQAASQFAQSSYAKTNLSVEQLQRHFASYLCISDLPPVDLFIRTSGEQRISNFFLWQLAYAELYFTEVLWPDFNETEFDKALSAFAHRKRRFGNVEVASS